MTQTIATMTVDALIENGVETLYCVPGVQNDHFFDAIYDRRDKLHPVQARHEQGAVYMALGAALATGKPQAFSLVPGPGFLNGAAALCTAYALNAPIFGVIGQIHSGGVGKRFGMLHEIENQIDVMKTLTKHAETIAGPQTAAADLKEAWSAMVSGRPQPAALEIPVDQWLKPASYDAAALKAPATPAPEPSPDDIARAAQMITEAKRPLVIVGGGAQDHAEPIRKLVTLIGAGASAFRTGHGVVSYDNPLWLNQPAAHALWPDCDLVIGLGTRLITQKKQWGLDDDIKVLQIDLDAEVMSRVCDPTLGVVADLGVAVPALLAALPDQPMRDDWRGKVAETRATVMAELGEALAPQFAWLDAIRKAMPDDGIFVDELTQIGYVSRLAFPTYQPRTFLSTGYQGTLGYGIATAIGAAHARRDVPVVSVAGDGGALFTITELASAVHHNIPVNVIVMNDNAYGNVKGMQRDMYDQRYIASDLTSPNFVALAHSFGVTAHRAESPAELTRLLSDAIANPGPNLIEVKVGEFPSPWDRIMLPKVRGADGKAG